MAFELTAARLLMPDFGMGIDVWAAVIGATLGFLALGYWIGGKIADARPSAVMLAVVLLLAAGSLLLVRSIGSDVPKLMTNMPLVSAAWCSAGLIAVGPLLLLGAVPPMLARLMLQATARTGTVVGGLMAAGTLGGLLGTWLTAVVLIPHVGVSRTLLILGCGAAAMGVVVLAVFGRWRPAACALCLAAVTAGVAGWTSGARPNDVRGTRVLEQVEGLYGHLQVLRSRGTRVLVCNGVFQSACPVSGFGIARGTLIRGRDYVELIAHFRPRTRMALLIGLGGALHPQALACYGVDVHCVEIEPAVVDLSREYFGLEASATVADGRAFLARDARRFDAIILDAFLGGTVAEHLHTREAFEQMAQRLHPGGLLAIHLISRPQHVATRAVARTLGAVFRHVVAVRSGFGDGLQHLYLFASQRSVELAPEQRIELDRYGFTGDEFFHVRTEDAPLLTDDRSCLALLSRDLVAEHRNRSRQLRRSPTW